MDNELLLNQNQNAANNGQIEDELAYYNTLPPCSKVRYLLEKNKLTDEGFDDILSLSKDVEALSTEAQKPDASEETKKQFAAATIDLHIKMLHFLYDLQVNQPERFNSNGLIANIIAAYNVNANTAVKAIEDARGEVFPDLCDRVFNNTVKEAKRLNEEPVERSKARFDRQLSDMVYLARLKEEYERVNTLNKKGEILTELFTENFLPNQKRYLDTSNLFKKCKTNFAKVQNAGELNDIAVKKIIDESAIEHAEEVYDDVYSYAEQGFGSEEAREKAKLKIFDVEETKRVANNIGIKQGEDPSLKDFNNHPALDTIYIKKHIKLFQKEGGEQKNVAITLRQKQDERREYERQLQKVKEDAGKKFDNEFENMLPNFKKLGGPYTYVLAKAENDQVILNNTAVIKKITESDLPLEEKNRAIEGAAAANQVALEEKSKNSEKISSYGDEGAAAQKNYNNYIYMKNHPERKEQKRNEAIAAAERKFKEDYPDQRIPQVLNEGSVLQLVLVDERIKFENAKQANNKDEMKRIREARYKRDQDFKQKNTELYAPVNYKGKTVYVTREREDAANQIKLSYDTYRRENNLENDLYIEEEYDEDVRKYNVAEDFYRMEVHVDKRDRLSYEMQNFRQDNYSGYVRKIDINSVEISPEVTAIRPENLIAVPAPKYTNDQLNRIGMSSASNDEMASSLDDQIANMQRRHSIFGTSEYTDIENGMKALSAQLKNDAPAIEIANKARILNSKLNLYIDRKLDEKDSNRNETDRAKGRREAAESARIIVSKIFEENLKRAGEIQKDHPFEEAAADLEAVMKSTNKMEDPTLQNMMTKIKERNYSDALTDMFTYLDANKGKVRDNEGNYIFRLRENEENARRRLPKIADGKIYKTVLLNFEKLEKAYLKELAEKEPWKLPRAVYKAEHLGANSNHTLNNYLKINVDTDKYKDIHKEIRPSESVGEHILQFENRYLYYMNQASFTNEASKRRWGEAEYVTVDAVPLKNQQEMVDAALSVYYLKNNSAEFMGNGQFDLQKAEEGRKKFISAVRKSGAYNQICQKSAYYFDLNNISMDKVQSTNKARREALNNTDKFKTVIVSEQLSRAIANKLGHAGELLIENGKFKKDEVNKDMDMVGYNLKVASVLGLENQVKDRAQELLNSPLKGASFRESQQKAAEKFKERTVIKEEALAQRVDAGKIMMK